MTVLGLAPERRGSQKGNEHIGNTSKRDLAAPYIDVLCQFRQAVRRQAKENGNSELLRYTDWLRDEELPRVGISVDDVSSTSMWYAPVQPAVGG